MDRAMVERLNRVLNEVYGGDKAAMGHAIGVDRTTCHRYLNGSVAVTRRTCVALSQDANIRLDWLERGVGGAMIQYTELSSATSIDQFGLPVFSAPLEDAPSATSPNRLGVTLIAMPPYYESKRYWVKVSRSMEAAVVLGDYILIKPIQMRSPDEDDIDRLRVVKRGDKIQLDKVNKNELLPSAPTHTKICGIPVLLHRDLM